MDDRPQHLFAAERQQLLGQRRRPLAGFLYFADVRPQRIVGVHLGKCYLGVPDDCGEQVVKIVRNPARKQPDRLHPL